MYKLEGITRILFLTTHASYFKSHRLPIARFLLDHGVEVIVAAAIDTDISILEQEGFRFCHVPFRRQGTNILIELYTLFCVTKIYLKEKPSLVHHISHKPILYGSIAARLAGIKAIVGTVTGLGYSFIARGLKARVIRLMIEILYKLSILTAQTHFIFQNPDDRSLFIRKGFISSSRTTLIYGSGVDTRIFTPTPEAHGVPVVILAARMLWSKGVGDFVDAARLIKSRGITAKFILAGAAGDSNPQSISTSQLEIWSKEGIVEWVGHDRDVPTLLSKAHIVCLPSYGEGLPLVLAEAAAAGKPIVTTDTPGCREVVEHDVNGFLVPSHDSHELAKRIEHLLIDFDLRQRMGAASRSMSMKKFSVEHIIAQTIEVYINLHSYLIPSSRISLK